MQKEFYLPEEHLTAEFRDYIVHKASSIFLWTVIVIGRLLKAWDRGLPTTEIRSLLHRLPSELEGLFEDTLGTIEPADRSRSLALFQTAICAARPLTALELRNSLLLSSDNPPRSQAALPERNADQDLQRFDRYITDLSAGLFEVVRSPSQDYLVVQVIHESMRDFFRTQSSIQTFHLSGPMFTSTGRKTLLKACINFLRLEENQEVIKEVPSISELVSCLYRPFDDSKLMTNVPFSGFVRDHMMENLKTVLMNSNLPAFMSPLESAKGIIIGWFLVYRDSIVRINTMGSAAAFNEAIECLAQSYEDFRLNNAGPQRLMRCVNNLWMCAEDFRRSNLHVHQTGYSVLERLPLRGHRVMVLFTRCVG